MKVAIIGFGSIGHERYNALLQLQQEGLNLEKVGIYDPYYTGNFENFRYNSLKEVEKDHPDWVIVATPHKTAVEMVKNVIPWECNILMEKPFGTTLWKANHITSMLRFDNQLHIGFNYRFFKGIQALYSDIIEDSVYSNVFGKNISSINIELGHGGSPSDLETWKSNPKECGFGALLDPGVHALDLLRLFSYETPTPLYGLNWKGFWKTGIQEEVSIMLDDIGTIINLKISLVKWKSTFKIEVNGKDGYGIVSGRGKSYGPQTYTRGKRWGWLDSGKSQKETEEVVVTDDCSSSFHDELDALFGNARKYSIPPCTAFDALNTMKFYDECLKVIR